MTPKPSFWSGDRPYQWLFGGMFALTLLSVGGTLHRSCYPDIYHRNFNPVVEGQTEAVYGPVPWVDAGSPPDRSFLAILKRRDGLWHTEQFWASRDDPEWGSVAGTVTVVEDADDRTTRIVGIARHRKDGRVYRLDYVIHVNPLGRAEPPVRPGIWTQVDRLDLEKPIWLPRDRSNIEDL